MFKVVLSNQHRQLIDRRPSKNGDACAKAAKILCKDFGWVRFRPSPFIQGISSSAERLLWAQNVAGSIPASPTKFILHRSKAAMQRAVNSPIAGSIPADAAISHCLLKVRNPAHNRVNAGSIPVSATTFREREATKNMRRKIQSSSSRLTVRTRCFQHRKASSTLVYSKNSNTHVAYWNMHFATDEDQVGSIPTVGAILPIWSKWTGQHGSNVYGEGSSPSIGAKIYSRTKTNSWYKQISGEKPLHNFRKVILVKSSLHQTYLSKDCQFSWTSNLLRKGSLCVINGAYENEIFSQSFSQNQRIS